MINMLQTFTSGRDGTGDGAKTWFSICSFIVLFKFFLSGMSFFDMDFGQFDSQGASMLIAAFGGVYWGRSNTKAKENSNV